MPRRGWGWGNGPEETRLQDWGDPGSFQVQENLGIVSSQPQEHPQLHAPAQSRVEGAGPAWEHSTIPIPRSIKQFIVLAEFRDGNFCALGLGPNPQVKRRELPVFPGLVQSASPKFNCWMPLRWTWGWGIGGNPGVSRSSQSWG